MCGRFATNSETRKVLPLRGQTQKYVIFTVFFCNSDSTIKNDYETAAVIWGVLARLLHISKVPYIDGYDQQCRAERGF